MVCEDLSKWSPRQYPEKRVFEGRYVRIEPLNIEKHGDELYEVSGKRWYQYYVFI